MIDGVSIIRLKRVPDDRGSVMRMLRTDDPHYKGFAEVYFSTVNPGGVKGWKRHNEMTMNVAVPVGHLLYVLYDDRPDSLTKGMVQEIDMGPHDYKMVVIPPGLWTGFKCLSETLTLVANCPSILYRPGEADDLPPSDPSIPYHLV
ncbi:MAG TPA: dTDP-4-dehydrorhamnose 3,5-epimerase family protein [Candidatus Sulfotelmatobacter sp.]|jgi:dTDP-4-dehydrorhamnose 3,5-epimerase|nr:dTDP-4-dehydrorhamnose 3,5-epimerase family protein [Candidatus Sulfotelmatobacter sp.]